MPLNSSNSSGRPHVGGGSHSHARSTNPLTNYEITGTVRWLDTELERIVIDVRGTDGHAGVFHEQDVTVDLETARLRGAHLPELVPGTPVRVKLRLPRRLGARPPGLLPAVSLTVLDDEAAA